MSKKETFKGQYKKIVYSIFNVKNGNIVIKNTRMVNDKFSGFIVGKILDSIIIGLITFIVCRIFSLEYDVLLAIIIGVTNIIPYFGPFLGAIPSAIIILMIDPMKCLTFVIIILMISPKKCLCFLIFVLILQQVDGNIIGPKILGDSTGLSSFWVIFAITLFGGLFGVFGMFIGVPVFAVIYAAIREFVNQRLAKKELPVPTTYYMENDYHSDDENINTGSGIKFVKKVLLYGL